MSPSRTSSRSWSKRSTRASRSKRAPDMSACSSATAVLGSCRAPWSLPPRSCRARSARRWPDPLVRGVTQVPKGVGLGLQDLPVDVPVEVWASHGAPETFRLRDAGQQDLQVRTARLPRLRVGLAGCARIRLGGAEPLRQHPGSTASPPGTAPRPQGQAWRTGPGGTPPGRNHGPC